MVSCAGKSPFPVLPHRKNAWLLICSCNPMLFKRANRKKNERQGNAQWTWSGLFTREKLLWCTNINILQSFMEQDHIARGTFYISILDIYTMWESMWTHDSHWFSYTILDKCCECNRKIRKVKVRISHQTTSMLTLDSILWCPKIMGRRSFISFMRLSNWIRSYCLVEFWHLRQPWILQYHSQNLTMLQRSAITFAKLGQSSKSQRTNAQAATLAVQIT